MRQQYKLFFAIAAVAISVAFIVVAGQVYPHLYIGAPDTEGNLDFFRQELVDRGMTMPMALATAAAAWAGVAIYYYVINSVLFDRWWHWLIVLAVTSLLTSYADWQYMNSSFAAENLDSYYSQYMLALSAWNAILAAALFTLASYGIRWWSSNCRHTPIPQ